MTVLAAGMQVRVQGVRGVFVAKEPCRSGKAWWCLRRGEMSGWRAFRPDRCRPVR